MQIIRDDKFIVEIYLIGFVGTTRRFIYTIGDIISLYKVGRVRISKIPKDENDTIEFDSKDTGKFSYTIKEFIDSMYKEGLVPYRKHHSSVDTYYDHEWILAENGKCFEQDVILSISVPRLNIKDIIGKIISIHISDSILYYTIRLDNSFYSDDIKLSIPINPNTVVHSNDTVFNISDVYIKEYI